MEYDSDVTVEFDGKSSGGDEGQLKMVKDLAKQRGKVNAYNTDSVIQEQEPKLKGAEIANTGGLDKKQNATHGRFIDNMAL